MALISVILVALWTFVVIRLLCSRATLRDRSLATYIAIGTFAAPIFVTILLALVNSYVPQHVDLQSDSQYSDIMGRIHFFQHLLNLYAPWSGLVAMALVIGALLWPVLTGLFRRQTYRFVSVADAFLLAFLVGWGFDLSGALLASVHAQGFTQGLGFLPPWVLSLESKNAVAGYGYWCGFIALTMAALLRFVRKRQWVIGGTIAAVLLAILDANAAFHPDQRFMNWISLLTLHGNLIPVVSLIGLIWLSWLETAWVKKAINAPAESKYQILEEWQEFWKLLSAGKFAEYFRLRALLGARRQVQIGQAELAQTPQDARLASALETLKARKEKPDSPQTEQRGLETFWLKSSRLQIASFGILIFMGLLVPKLPDKIGSFLWTLLLIHPPSQIMAMPVLTLALLVVLFWRYLLAPARLLSPFTPDDHVEFRGERTLSGLLPLVILGVLMYGSIQEFYPFNSTVAYFRQLNFPAFDQPQLTFLLLLFALGVTGLALPRAWAWKAVSKKEQLAARMRRGSILVTMGFVIWAGLRFYAARVQNLHTDAHARILFGTVGGAGNNLSMWVGGLLTALLCFGTTKLIVYLLKRSENAIIKKLTGF